MLYITHNPNEKNVIMVNKVAVLELTFPGNSAMLLVQWRTKRLSPLIGLIKLARVCDNLINQLMPI